MSRRSPPARASGRNSGEAHEDRLPFARWVMQRSLSALGWVLPRFPRRPAHAGPLLAAALLVASAGPASAQAGREILRTDSGAPLKLIIRCDAALFERPDRTSRSQPVR